MQGHEYVWFRTGINGKFDYETTTALGVEGEVFVNVTFHERPESGPPPRADFHCVIEVEVKDVNERPVVASTDLVIFENASVRTVLGEVYIHDEDSHAPPPLLCSVAQTQIIQ